MSNPAPLRSVLFIVPILAASLAVIGLPILRGQSPKPALGPADAAPDLPKYDVAAIKPTSESKGLFMFTYTSDGIAATGVATQTLLVEAFHVEDDHIIGAPAWVKTKRYDVQAKVAPEDSPKLDKLTFDERGSMLVSLLAERFNLKYHHESREMPGYALVIAKGGPKMKVSDIQAPPPKPPDQQTNPKHEGEGGDTPRREPMLRMMGRGHVEAVGTDMGILANVLSGQLRRTVTDQTGLTGNYDFTLQWTPDDAPPPMAGGAEGGPPRNESGSNSAGPSLFTAVQEQLGLKLQSEKRPADIIVIDHIDPPSEN